MGVVTNQPKFAAGCLDINASDKAARFVRRCDAFNIQLLTIVDVPGFLPGTGQERRHHSPRSKTALRVLRSHCTKVTMIVRKAYGGHTSECATKNWAPTWYLLWPNAEIAVMGAEGAANIVFRNDIQNAEDPVARERKIAEYEEEIQ